MEQKKHDDSQHMDLFPLRIAMLGQKSALTNEGGVEVVVRELSTRMASLGHDVTCYNRKGHHVSGKEYDGILYNIAEYKGVKMKSVFTVNWKGLAAVTSSVFASIRVAFGNYDVVHYHAEGTCAMLWLPKLFGKRCVSTIHGLDHQRKKWQGSFGSKYIKFGEKVAVKFSDEIIVLTKGVQDYFAQTYDRKTELIPNGVNQLEIKEEKLMKEKWGLEKDDYILYLGRIVPEKGLGYLIKAYRAINTDKKLVIAGGVSDTTQYLTELKNLSKICLNQLYTKSDNNNANSSSGKSQVIFTGFVDGQIKEELYSNAYVYVLPSDLEGMPLSLLEAMSYGNCCLVSDIDGCVSVVSDKKNGDNKAVIFRCGDVLDLQEKLQMLCDDKTLVEKYKKNATNYICGKYDWDKIVEDTLRLYRRK